jgi:hypothetical protein
VCCYRLAGGEVVARSREALGCRVECVEERKEVGRWGGDVNQVTINQAYAKLEALKTHLPEGLCVEEKYVREYHEILTVLERETGINLSSFRVPREEIGPKVVSSNRLERTVTYAKGNHCDRSYLLMKIERIMSFFRLEASKAAIGFVPPQTQK